MTTDTGYSLPTGMLPFQKAVAGGLNLPQDKILANVAANIRRPLLQLQPHEPQDIEMILAAGGPSLEQHLDDLLARYHAGAKVIAVNGTHDWLMERGVRPSLFFMLDARASNARFVRNPHEKCRYVIASQCDPLVFDTIIDQGVDPIIFHCELGTDKLISLLDRHYFGAYYLVIGGSTVTIRTLMAARMLGLSKFHVYGFDACYLDGKDHSYPQPENAKDARIKVTVTIGKDNDIKVDESDIAAVQENAFASRIFECAPWMAVQLDEFAQMFKMAGHLFELNIVGDGMIAWTLEQWVASKNAAAKPQTVKVSNAFVKEIIRGAS